MSATHSPLVEPDKQISRHPALLKAISPQACAGHGRRCLAYWLSCCLSKESLSGSSSLLACFSRASISSHSSVVESLPSGSPPLLQQHCFQQGPFAPRALPRFLARMGLSDSRPEPIPQLWIPSGRWVRSPVPTLPGLPGSSTDLSPRAVPKHPGRPGGCICSLLPHRCQASSPSADWPPP